jgi:DNA replication protein DnaC
LNIYEKFLEELLKCEIQGREEKRFEKRLKHAAFPKYKTLDEFELKDYSNTRSNCS